MKVPIPKQGGIVAALALFAAAATYWLSIEFRPSGVLGILQVGLQGMFVFPYVFGAVIGGNAHNPNSAVFAVTLFIEFLLLFLLLRFLLKRLYKYCIQ